MLSAGLQRKVNECMAEDVQRLLEREDFQRFFFWLLEESAAFALPDISQLEQEQVLFKEGRRSLGLGLVALLGDFALLDRCRRSYEQQLELLRLVLERERQGG